MRDLGKTVIVNDLFSEKCALKSTKTNRKLEDLIGSKEKDQKLLKIEKFSN